MPNAVRILNDIPYGQARIGFNGGAGPMRTVYHFEKPIVRLLKELAKRPRAGRIHIEKGDFKLELNASA